MKRNPDHNPEPSDRRLETLLREPETYIENGDFSAQIVQNIRPGRKSLRFRIFRISIIFSLFSVGIAVFLLLVPEVLNVVKSIPIDQTFAQIILLATSTAVLSVASYCFARRCLR